MWSLRACPWRSWSPRSTGTGASWAALRTWLRTTERAWQLTDDGWIYVVEEGERAGKGLATLLVDDLDARIGQLNERGIETGEVERLSETTRKLVVTDPDGNRITLGEAVSARG
jgi:hypothetical protein